MKLSSTKTVRFTAVAKASGQPELVTLWTPPEKDNRFRKALHENRVLTVKQEHPGNRPDFGIVGFLREKGVSYLIFPKSLAKFQDRRVIGIKYELIKTPGPLGAPVHESGAKRRHPHPGASPEIIRKSPEHELTSARRAKPPALKHFTVTVRFVSSVDVQSRIEAATRKAAKNQALRTDHMPGFSEGKITRKVMKLVEERSSPRAGHSQ